MCTAVLFMQNARLDPDGFGQPELLHYLALNVNADIKSRITFSQAIKPLNCTFPQSNQSIFYFPAKFSSFTNALL